MPRTTTSSLLMALLAAVPAAVLAVEPPATGPVDFNREVRPILADNCFHCHGPDAARRQGDLRLDLREEAVAVAALVPGAPDKSKLVERILSTNDDERMPPPESNKKLTEQQKQVLQRWISEGAEYQGHWAFIPPVRPQPPEVAPEVRVVNPIDQFVGAQLAREGLHQAGQADRATLIRRVSLDLTGLPPTLEELDAFVADNSPQAYEQLVDHLLESPRYGERMAMHWLDSARYADSNGYQTDSSRQMWRWREWVISAFNRNQPFDQFTIEQLAGDMLPTPTQEQLIATGFHRNGRLNGEGGRIVEEWFAETVIDRVETTGQTWLALTLGCCRCHDHKYDPITQKEFYQLFAYFNSVDESGVLDREGGNSRPLLTVPTPEQTQQQEALQLAIQAAEARIATAQQDLPKLQAAWETRFAAELAQAKPVWTNLEPTSVASSGGATLKRLDDGTWLAGGENPAHDVYTITGKLPALGFSGLRIDVLPDPSLPNQSLGRAFNGNFVLTGVEIEIRPADTATPAAGAPPAAPITPVLVRAVADYEQSGYTVQSVLSDPKVGWAINGNEADKRLQRKAMFLTSAPVEAPADSTITVRLRHNSQFANHAIGRFRLSVTSTTPATVTLDGASVPDDVRLALQTDPAQRTPSQQDTLAKYFRELGDNPLTRANADLAAARKKLADLEGSLATTMIMKELPQPRAAYVLKRGEYDKPGDSVERALPQALPPAPPGTPVNRLGLAQWLAAPDHPLTARVWVNRQWEKFFGTGIVKTVDNFGLQSAPPTHPELLDWLATEFVRLNWDMKALQKLIVMSATYQQSSHVTPELWQRDPENRWLSRGPRFRLPAELVRDQSLAVSGLLVEKLGGPSVRPYMPAGVWDETSKYGDLRGYTHDKGDGLYRRTLYTIWKRTAAPPTMLMFDSPSREVCAVKRARTNTPLQALALLNEVTYVEAARALASRMVAVGGSAPAERIAWAFRRVTGRTPDPAETAILTAGFEKHLNRFRADTPAAQKLLAVGELPNTASSDTAELAAYTLTANVLLNLDEVVTRE